MRAIFRMCGNVSEAYYLSKAATPLSTVQYIRWSVDLYWGLQRTGLRVTQILPIDYSYIWLLSNKLDKCYMNVIEEDL